MLHSENMNIFLENGSKPLIAEEVLTPLTEWYGKMKKMK